MSEMSAWGPDDTERDTLPPPSPRITRTISRLLAGAGQRSREAAKAALDQYFVEAEYENARSLDPAGIQGTRNAACRAFAALVPALEAVEAEAQRLGLVADLEPCLVNEVHPRCWVLSGSALAALDLRRVGDGVRVEKLHERADELNASASALEALAEELFS